jgi:hypothetical protein
MPVRASPLLNRPRLAWPRHNYPPKRAAEGAEAPSAAVCSCCPILPDLALACHATTHGAAHCRIWIPKNPAERAEALSAEINQQLPVLTRLHLG